MKTIDDKIHNGQRLIVLETGDAKDFEMSSDYILSAGYSLSSSSCGFVDSEKYDFCQLYQAVFELHKGRR